MTIVSSDKDLMQLVAPGVSMLDPIKNRAIGPAEVFEKFGVAPEKVVDVQSLAGDSTDNIPGVPGIGIKTAAALIAEYGDLDTLLARASEIKQPKRRESLLEFADQARLSRRLVRLADDAPVPLPLDEVRAQRPDPEVLFPFLRLQGFKNIVARIENEFLHGHRPVVVLIWLLVIEVVVRLRSRLVEDDPSLAWIVVDNLRIGLVYAVLLEAFKLGS